MQAAMATQLEHRLTEIADRASAIANQAQRARDGASEARLGELAEELAALDRAHEELATAIEEVVPPEPMERVYERMGVRPASAEQFEAFVREHEIPREGE